MAIRLVTDRNGRATQTLLSDGAVRVLTERKAKRVKREAADRGVRVNFWPARKVAGYIAYREDRNVNAA